MEESRFRYFVKLSYLGTGFHGWQIQPGSPTIQQTLEEALSLLLKEEIRLTGAGRTDAGVHARVFYAHFTTTLSPELVANRELVYKSNRLLPPGIAVHDVFPVAANAHTRFDAISRSYQYFICTEKDPFWYQRAWQYERPLNMMAMQEAAHILKTHDDFSSFARSNTQVKTNICQIYQATWESDGHLRCFSIKADRFLRNMVRAIVGTMMDVGHEKISPEDFDLIIRKKDRRCAGYSAPAWGLYLTDIQYPYTVI